MNTCSELVEGQQYVRQPPVTTNVCRSASVNAQHIKPEADGLLQQTQHQVSTMNGNIY